MSSRSKVTHAIQVFPFLAVLVCTMGALIFLLLLMTRQVRKREIAFAANERVQRALAKAVAAAMPANAPQEEQPQSQDDSTPRLYVFPEQPVTDQKPMNVPDQAYELALAEREREQKELTIKWKLKTRQLQADREQKQSVLDRHKSLVDAALQRTSAIQADVDDLADQLEQFTSETDAENSSEEEIVEQRRIEKQIAEMKKRLRAAQLAEGNGENEKFQVVPFDPQSGTTRRPILLECTAAGIRFLPEGIVITPADLTGFTPRANPLAAGTGALINYWNEWKSKQKDPRAQPDPYPLLLVRPDGVVAYYVAMKMLEPIKANHGYELIEESTVLQLPELDPDAKAACEAAVQRLKSERDNIRRSAMRSGEASTVFGASGRGGSGTGGYGSGSGSGNGRGGGRTGGGRGSGGGYADSGNRGNGIGGRPSSSGGSDAAPGGSSSNGSIFTVNDLESGEEEVGDHSWERIENFQGRRAGSRGEGLASNDADSPGGNSGVRGNGSGSGSGGGSGGGGGGRSGGGGGGRSGGGGTGDETDGGSIGSSDGSGGAVGGSVNESGGNSGASARGGNKKIFGFRLGSSGSDGGTSSSDSDASSGEAGEDDEDASDANSTRSSTGAKKSGKGSARNGTNRRAGNNTGSLGADSTSSEGNSGDASGSDSAGAEGSSAPADGGNSAGSANGTSGDSNATDASNGATNGNTGKSRRRRNVPVDSQERWSSDVNSGKANANGSDSGSDAYIDNGPGMPIGRRPGSKTPRANQNSDQGAVGPGDENGDATDGQSGSDSGASGSSQTGGQSSRVKLSDNDSAGVRTSRGSRSSASSRPATKRDKSDDPNKKLEPEMLVGRHWGYSESGAGIGFERDVRVDVSNEKLVIGERHEIPVGRGETTQETFELFVRALDRSSHEWGRPPQGFFWAPRLKFVVKPDATGRYEQINSLMERAGISTSQEFAKTAGGTSTIEYGRDPELTKKPVPKTSRKYSSGGTQ